MARPLHITQFTLHSLSVKQGQALVELAVFGSALMVVLAILVRLGMTFQFRQTLQQDAFRKALAVSQIGQDDDEATLAKDQAVYTIVEDRRIPDPTDPLVQSSRFPVVAQNQVLWGTDLFFRDSEEGFPFVFEVNGNTLEFPSTEFAKEDTDDVDVGDGVDEGIIDLNGDGIDDRIDIDDDGIADGLDTDGDGVIDVVFDDDLGDEVDVDGDGTVDGIDTDGDGDVDMAFDDVIDIDGDGTDDSIDLDGDGIADGLDLDGDGVMDVAFDDVITGLDTGGTLDLDGDGIADGIDVDGDGDIDVVLHDTIGSTDRGDLGLATDTFRFVNRTTTLGRAENETQLETTRSFVDNQVSGTTPDGLDVTGKTSEVIVRRIKTKSNPDPGVPVVSELPTPARVEDMTWTTLHPSSKDEDDEENP